MTRILMVASEAAPFVKTGGLADVLGALPPALRKRGEEVAVVLPRYGSIGLQEARRVYDNLTLCPGLYPIASNIYRIDRLGVPYLFVDCPPLYDRAGPYADQNGDYPDNHIRFAAFAHAALGIARHVFRPDVIHCHDWQASLVPVYMATKFVLDPSLIGRKTLLTIHNLGYQGIFSTAQLGDIGFDQTMMESGELIFDGDVNLLKGGIVCADALSTVSRGYAREIQTPEYGFRLDHLLRQRSASLHGILNGVDYLEWNPETDPLIPANYSAADLSGKAICKQRLREEFALPGDDPNRPLIGIVSRFATQKGFDLIRDVAWELMTRDLQLAVLGTGEAQYEDLFRGLASARPDRVAVRVEYNNRLAHLIEAGADMFLMPSRYEPCGLNQIYSLRYGTVPIVRATGGLDDTIEAHTETATGFKFYDYTGQGLLGVIDEALLHYGDRDNWIAMMRRGMAKDFSWDASAAEYSALYRSLVESGAPSRLR